MLWRFRGGSFVARHFNARPKLDRRCGSPLGDSANTRTRLGRPGALDHRRNRGPFPDTRRASEGSRDVGTRSDTLTTHDIASAATCADRYRDSDRNTTKERSSATQLWRFVNIQTDASLGSRWSGLSACGCRPIARLTSSFRERQPGRMAAADGRRTSRHRRFPPGRRGPSTVCRACILPGDFWRICVCGSWDLAVRQKAMLFTRNRTSNRDAGKAGRPQRVPVLVTHRPTSLLSFGRREKSLLVGVDLWALSTC